MNAWRDFKGGKWQDRIDVRDFIQKNYTPYTGDESFLQPPTARTEKMLEKYEALCRAEQQNGGVEHRYRNRHHRHVLRPRLPR